MGTLVVEINDKGNYCNMEKLHNGIIYFLNKNSSDNISYNTRYRKSFNKVELLDKPPLELVKNIIYKYKEIIDLKFNENVDGKLAEYYYERKDNYFKLKDFWYDSLKENDTAKAYKVYADSYYFTDLLECYIEYSRSYLKKLYQKDLKNTDITFIEKTEKEVKTVLDLGCGLGLTTAALKQLYPNATVYATNLPNTYQWHFCTYMSEKYNFNLVDDINKIDTNIDLIFGSEYFEHIEYPLKHIKDILEKLDPKYLIIGNAFNTPSVGHFKVYEGNIDESKISNKFNKVIKDYNYKKLETGFWNNKPNVYVKENKNQTKLI